MSWLILVVAGLLEVVWATALRASDGFSRPLPAVITVVALAASVGLLGLALRSLPLGVAYTVWTGIGALGAVIVGFLWFGEGLPPARLVFVLLILVGVVGLRATEAEAPADGADRPSPERPAP